MHARACTRCFTRLAITQFSISVIINCSLTLWQTSQSIKLDQYPMQVYQILLNILIRVNIYIYIYKNGIIYFQPDQRSLANDHGCWKLKNCQKNLCIEYRVSCPVPKHPVPSQYTHTRVRVVPFPFFRSPVLRLRSRAPVLHARAPIAPGIAITSLT